MGRVGISLKLNFGRVLVPLGVEVGEAAGCGMVDQGVIGFGEGRVSGGGVDELARELGPGVIVGDGAVRDGGASFGSDHGAEVSELLLGGIEQLEHGDGRASVVVLIRDKPVLGLVGEPGETEHITQVMESCIGVEGQVAIGDDKVHPIFEIDLVPTGVGEHGEQLPPFVERSHLLIR